MNEQIRVNFLESYGHQIRKGSAWGITPLTPTEQQQKHFKDHGLARFHLLVSGYPEIFLIDTQTLGVMGAKYAWIQRMREAAIDVLISNGKQSPKTKRTRTEPEQAKNWSAEFDPSATAGLYVIVRYPPRVGSIRSPLYKTELKIISATRDVNESA